MTDSTSTGPIGIDDVRNALGNGDPFATNAGALQKLIGRGSNATVQKHLEAIRAERSPVATPTPGATPAAPADAVTAVWSAAYAAAQVHTLGRLERVTAEREQLAGTVAQLVQDLAAALGQVDAGEAAAAAASAEQVTALAQAQAETRTAAEQVEGLKQALEASKQALERLKAESEATIAMMSRDATIASQTQQMTIDNLNAQIHQRDMLLAQVHAPAPKSK